jgi:hypothetical protein
MIMSDGPIWPMPTPSTIIRSATPRYVVWTSMVARSMQPIVNSKTPVIGKILYRPVRAISRPDRIDAVSTPSIIGAMLTPERVALVSRTTWRKSGTNSVPP